MNREDKTDETTVDLDSAMEMERTALADPRPVKSARPRYLRHRPAGAGAPGAAQGDDDGLTQVFNKRKLEEELDRETARASRHGRPLSLILFDIDDFKEINDTYGHLCGDFALQQIARRTAEHLRPEQVFARVGGEEFVILSPEMSLADSRELAEKLQERFADAPFCHAERELWITCSSASPTCGRR